MHALLHGLYRAPWYGTLLLVHSYSQRNLTLDLMLASVYPFVDVTIYTLELVTSSAQFGGTITASLYSLCLISLMVHSGWTSERGRILVLKDNQFCFIYSKRTFLF